MKIIQVSCLQDNVSYGICEKRGCWWKHVLAENNFRFQKDVNMRNEARDFNIVEGLLLIGW